MKSLVVHQRKSLINSHRKINGAFCIAPSAYFYTMHRLRSFCLQQRSSNKITFPNVWINTCCSHQLNGMDMNEVDSLESLSMSSAFQWGSCLFQVFNWVTLLGSWYGHSRRGEVRMQLTIYKYLQCSVHKGLTLNGTLQIDYVLFVTVPDEVDDVRWVTQDTLLRCSPWFCLIAAGW